MFLIHIFDQIFFLFVKYLKLLVCLIIEMSVRQRKKTSKNAESVYGPYYLFFD